MSPLPRVLSYPPRHEYVDRLHERVATLVHRDQPWPRLPDLHDPGWLAAHGADWDVAHFHFTWEQYDVGHLRAVLDAHQRQGTPVVWTAHDLRNPHIVDRADDVGHLEALAAVADEVVTLTAGAAEEVAARFGRRARVVPHGPLSSPKEVVGHRRRVRRQAVTSRHPWRALLLAKSLRPNLDWRTPLEVVANLGAEDVPIVLDVHLHPDAPARAEVEAFATNPRVDLTVGDRLSRQALLERIGGSDVLVLPYAWGTHSGLLELATDLGVQVIATDVGYFSEQAPCHVVTVSGGRVEAGELRSLLVAQARGVGHLPPVAPADREAALQDFRSAHAEVYEGLVASPGTAPRR